MEAIFDLLNSYWSDEAVLRRILVGLSAVTIFILGIGLSVLVMNLTDPLRRRMAAGADGEAPADDIAVLERDIGAVWHFGPAEAAVQIDVGRPSQLDDDG